MTSDTTTGTAWEAGDRFMLRVAGLPVTAVDALRCEDAGRWADDVLAAEENLRAGAEKLSDLLHRAVGTTDPEPGSPGAAQRRELLRLRRQIHNNRLPASPEATLALVAAVDTEAAEHVAAWLRQRQDLEKLRAEGAALLDAELRRNRTALGELLADDRLRLGLLLASPALDGQLDPFLRSAAAGEKPGGRKRKVERSVLSYLYRTACKTSPFSTFTGIATGRFEAVRAGGTAERDVLVEETWTSRVRLNVVVLARLAELVSADPVRRCDLPLRLASGWGRDDDRVRYVRRWVTTGDDSAAVTFDAVKDRLFFLRRSGTLDRLLALFDERPELRHRELVDWLAREHDADTASCETYVAALLQLGMVRVPCLDTDVHSEDPLRSFRDALAGLDRPWSDRLAALLEAPAAALARYPEAGHTERARLLRALRTGLQDAQRELGAEDPVLPQTLLYEDVSAGRDLPCPAPSWAGGDGGALRSLERILPAFDLTLAQRITFEGFFVARYGSGGRCDDLLGLVHDFHEDFFDQYLSFTARRKPFDDNGDYVAEENWLGLPGIKALDSARRTFVDRMRQAWAAYDGTGELRLDEADVAEVAAELAPVSPGFAPRCHHVQLARENGTELTVLNRAYGGLSFPFSRFTHVYDTPAPGPGDPAGAAALSDALRATATRITPDGAVLAEVTGGPVTTNLNLHGRLTDYEIVCPGETGTVPEEHRIHLEDLYAVHDADEGRVLLRSRRLDREVVPVYLGYLVPLALPAIPRTLLLLSPSSMSPLDVWAGVPEGASRGGVTARPRVVHGDVVLSRASWSTTAGDLPAPRPGAGEEELFLDWQRWRREHGLPEQVFATVSAGPAGVVGAKPQYVDFRSHLSLGALEALLRDPGHRVVLREMLPARDGLHVRTARGAHVAELAVETFTRHPRGASACQS